MLLGVLVLLLHGLGLQSLSATWPTFAKPLAPVQIQLQMSRTAHSSPETVTAGSIASTVQPPRAKTTSASSHAVSLSDHKNTNSAASRDDLHAASTETIAANEASEMPANAPVEAAQVPAQPATPPADKQAQAPIETVATPTPDKPVTTPAWLSEAKFSFPASSKLLFDFVGESKGIRYNADGELLWQHDGHRYQMRQEVRHLLFGSRSQTSTGELGVHGLQPVRFGDKYKQEVAAHFEREKQLISFSSNTASQALQDGAQDRLSLLAQLTSLMAGSPGLRQNGQVLTMQIASARSADVWTFHVDRSETLKLPIGSLPSLKLSRVTSQPHDQTIEIWLSPTHGFLPAKVRIAQSNGDVLEQLLRKIETP